MAIPKQKSYTVDEFEAFIARPENQDRLFELIDGEIVEKMPTERHGFIAVNVSTELRVEVKRTEKGRVVAEVRHRTANDDYNARQPDISYYMDAERPIVDRGAVRQLPDLAVEIKSPDDSYRRMREKADYYLANGTKMVWLIYPEKRLVEVFTLGGDSQILDESDTLDCGDIIPGFKLAVRDIFAE